MPESHPAVASGVPTKGSVSGTVPGVRSTGTSSKGATALGRLSTERAHRTPLVADASSRGALGQSMSGQGPAACGVADGVGRA